MCDSMFSQDSSRSGNKRKALFFVGVRFIIAIYQPFIQEMQKFGVINLREKKKTLATDLSVCFSFHTIYCIRKYKELAKKVVIFIS